MNTRIILVRWLVFLAVPLLHPWTVAVGSASVGAESTDLYNDPLPHGAVARMGSCRFACLGPISDLLYTPDSDRIVIVERRRITVREVGTGKFVCRIQASGDGEFYCAAVARDGKRLVTYNINSIGSKGLIQYWPLSANPRPSRTVRLERQSDGLLKGRHCLSGDAQRAVLWFRPTGGSIGKIRVLDLVSGEILFEHSPRLFCNAAISTDGKTLWTLNGKLGAWDIDSKSLQTETHITDRVRLDSDEIRSTAAAQPTATEVQPNTPENRKAVGDEPEDPFSKQSPAPGDGVPVEPGKTTKSAARAKQLKAGAKEFWLFLQHKAYETDSQRSVILYGPESLMGQSRDPNAARVEIPADAVQKLIDHLQADGFLARAIDAKQTAKVFSGWPYYTLAVGAVGGSGYRADLGWDERTASRIDELAKVFGEDSPKAVAALKAISTSVKQHLAEAAKLKDYVPETLGGSLDRFVLYLRFTPGQSGKYKNLVLSVPDLDRTWDPNFWVSARITKDDALRIIQHLAAKGFFARCGTVRPNERKILPSPRGPAYTLKEVLQTAELAATPKNDPWYKPQRLAGDKARVNALAARALLQMKDSSGRAVLLRELRSEDPFRRQFAAETFARFGTKQDVPVLAGCLSDKYHEVRHWACAGLQRVTGISFQTSNTRHAPEYYLGDWTRWWARTRRVGTE